MLHYPLYLQMFCLGLQLCPPSLVLVVTNFQIHGRVFDNHQLLCGLEAHFIRAEARRQRADERQKEKEEEKLRAEHEKEKQEHKINELKKDQLYWDWLKNKFASFMEDNDPKSSSSS